MLPFYLCIFILHFIFFFFFFNDTATTEIYTLSLHDALPISGRCASRKSWARGGSPSGTQPCSKTPACRASASVANVFVFDVTPEHPTRAAMAATSEIRNKVDVTDAVRSMRNTVPGGDVEGTGAGRATSPPETDRDRP